MALSWHHATFLTFSDEGQIARAVADAVPIPQIAD
jgi:hypothetical protein